MRSFFHVGCVPYCRTHYRIHSSSTISELILRHFIVRSVVRYSESKQRRLFNTAGASAVLRSGFLFEEAA